MSAKTNEMTIASNDDTNTTIDVLIADLNLNVCCGQKAKKGGNCSQKPRPGHMTCRYHVSQEESLRADLLEANTLATETVNNDSEEEVTTEPEGKVVPFPASTPAVIDETLGLEIDWSKDPMVSDMDLEIAMQKELADQLDDKVKAGPEMEDIKASLASVVSRVKRRVSHPIQKALLDQTSPEDWLRKEKIRKAVENRWLRFTERVQKDAVSSWRRLRHQREQYIARELVKYSQAATGLEDLLLDEIDGDLAVERKREMASKVLEAGDYTDAGLPGIVEVGPAYAMALWSRLVHHIKRYRSQMKDAPTDMEEYREILDKRCEDLQKWIDKVGAVIKDHGFDIKNRHNWPELESLHWGAVMNAMKCWDPIQDLLKPINEADFVSARREKAVALSKNRSEETGARRNRWADLLSPHTKMSRGEVRSYLKKIDKGLETHDVEAYIASAEKLRDKSDRFPHIEAFISALQALKAKSEGS